MTQVWRNETFDERHSWVRAWEADRKSNVISTPTFLIDGKTYAGEKDLEFFADKVDDLTN